MTGGPRVILHYVGGRWPSLKGASTKCVTAAAASPRSSVFRMDRPMTWICINKAHPISTRFLSDAAHAASGSDVSGAVSGTPPILSSPKLQGLYDRIVDLPERDVNILGAMIIQLLGRTIFPGEFGGGGFAAGTNTGGEADTVGGNTIEAEVKTIFDLKLVGFDAKVKIKVIKEVRAIVGLGLKEAKELVESAPKIIQKELKQEKAEELKAQLEAVGAEIELV